VLIVKPVSFQNPEGSMKLKKLQKLVIKELQECGGLSEDKEGLRATLMEKVSNHENKI
jgi:cell growth-regulating nucleolar protein